MPARVLDNLRLGKKFVASVNALDEHRPDLLTRHEEGRHEPRLASANMHGDTGGEGRVAADRVQLKLKPEGFHNPAQRVDVRPDASRLKAGDRGLVATHTDRKVSLGYARLFAEPPQVLTDGLRAFRHRTSA